MRYKPLCDHIVIKGAVSENMVAISSEIHDFLYFT